MAKSKEIDTQSSKERLLESYLQLCYEQGAAAITIQMIADRAKVAFGTVRYYFAEEENRIDFEAIRYTADKIYSFIDEQMFQQRRQSGFNPLHAYVKVMGHWAQKFPHHASYEVYYYYLCATNVETPISNQSFRERAYARIESLLNEAIGMGLYPQIRHKTETAKMIHALVLGTVLTVVTSHRDKSARDFLENCQKNIDALIGHTSV